ncbi:hypothetical protein [Pelagovum pacificum]|uniref:Uncharacterized protein n=1 Tax=Pelagovum pacificum TaxID=2588711 RepID=A0A5C5G901_9RHOB|nr:hypothetical protein [Pelagovum pacificum]QQA41488.1 hypothetical protein I8N54_11675 [Pelagovum pacificum]TNY30512.1 hypothetical protein FHY64_19825 [Pelagovum pacificum]
MRLIAVIFLTSLLMLAASPQMSAAGAEMHDCTVCPETMVPADRQISDSHHQVEAPCADMVTCGSHALLDGSQPLHENDQLPLRHAWPEPRIGTTISLSLDLPPPRA